MAKNIAFANQKGGVGKTTSSINFSASLNHSKKRTLLIDLDPQGNATMGSGIDKNQISTTITEVLLGEKDIQEAIIYDTQAGFSIIPANGELTIAEVTLLRKANQESTLKKALQTINHLFDFIVIDCPPSLNMLTLNALVAAHSVIIPMQCEYYALEGLSALMETIDQVRELNPILKIEGILRTMYDPRNRLSTEVSADLVKHFGSKVYQTVIPRNVRLAEAPSHGLPILIYNKGSRGSEAYLSLAKEFLKQNQKMQSSEKTLETA